MSVENSVGYKSNLSGTCGLAAFKCGQNEKRLSFLRPFDLIRLYLHRFMK